MVDHHGGLETSDFVAGVIARTEAGDLEHVHAQIGASGRIDVPTLRSRALDLGLATVDDMAEIQAAFSEWADEPDGWFAFIQGEVLATKP